MVDVEDLAAAAVLDPLDAGLVVLVDQRYAVALADAVVDAGHLDLQLAEFAALGAEVLRAGVEPVDLLVGGVGDQRDLAGVVGLGQRRPVLRGLLDGLIAGVGHVQAARGRR